MDSLGKGRLLPALFVLILATAGVGCGGDSDAGDAEGGGKPSAEAGREGGGEGKASEGGERRGRRGGGPGGGGPGRGGPGGFGPPGGEGESRGVPVEVATVGRGDISLFFETHGTLEAENEVDLVSRVTGPIVELKAEEGEQVKKGELLAKIDDREIVAQLEVTKVRLEEARQSFERIKSLFEKELVARDAYEQSLAAFEAARGDAERLEVQLAYTRITAPFSGLVVQRYVKFAEHLQAGARLFRLSDFDPLLCPVQVPERELSRLRNGQRAELTVESYPGRRFRAEVLRISPVVDAATGTVKVTLQVFGDGLLRPGMFAAVFLEMESRQDTLVVPKAALALDSLGNTVYVVKDGVAQRRDLELGFRNDALLEVLSGVEAGEQVVTVGQDGLSDGTPVEILDRSGARTRPGGASEGGEVVDGPADGESPRADGPPRAGRQGSGGFAGPDGPRGPGGPGGPFRNLDFDDPEQVQRVKDRMRERGLTDAEIEERLERMKARRERTREGGGAP